MKPKVTKHEAYRIKALVAEYLTELAQNDLEKMKRYRGKDYEHEETSYENARDELGSFVYFAMQMAYKEA